MGNAGLGGAGRLMRYYKCRTPTGAVLWQEITDDGAACTRLIDADGRAIPPGGNLSYAIVSVDQALWPVELLPAYRARKRASLATAYELAVVRDYPSTALGATYTYPSDLVAKLYMNARVSQALVVLSASPAWRASTPVDMRQRARPTVWNGWIYLCIAAGTTGVAEPAWPTTQDSTVADGAVTWRAWQPWSGKFICKDGGAFVRRNHSPHEMVQVGMDGAAFVQAQLDRRDTLAAQIDAAADLIALDAIGMEFP